MSNDVKQLIQNIRLLALDSDGVLTDGGVYVLEDGTEFRRFDIKDGLGLKRLLNSGIQVAIISASNANSIVHRAEHLGISHVFLGIEDKLETLRKLCTELGLSFEQVAYMGDDLTDLPVLGAVGFSCAPADAADEVRFSVLHVTCHAGGHSAVREICDLIVRHL